jgi:tetraacyldisaccharide 4'-kinase
MQTYLYNLATDKSRGLIASFSKAFLFALSLIYGLIVRILIFLNSNSAYRLGCKVISVGNITLGGTGKTTLVEYIARYLKSKGHKVAIISRGYKRKIPNSKSQIPNKFQIPNPNYQTLGDEPYMLLKKLGDIPVIVDADRIRATKRAIRDYSVDTVILDDGFQQWKIRKDLEIVTIDATNPFGNRQMLPRGILREPISSLRRADTFVITKCNLKRDTDEIKDALAKISPSSLIIKSAHQPIGLYLFEKPEELFSIDYLYGKTVSVFSGIGDPDAFENLIKGLGANIALAFRFNDHHSYTKDDLDKIARSSRDKNSNILITSEKDAARLLDVGVTLYDLRLLVLSIKLSFAEDEQRFRNRLLQLYSL